MNTVEWSIRHNDVIDAVDLDPALLVADVGKDWILDNGIAQRGAVNYGWRVSKTHSAPAPRPRSRRPPTGTIRRCSAR